MDDKPSEPETHAELKALALVCSECGELIEVSDPMSLVRSLHLQNACPSMRAVVGGEG